MLQGTADPLRINRRGVLEIYWIVMAGIRVVG
jgi:hypothetical protein